MKTNQAKLLQNPVAADVSRLHPPSNQSGLTSAATVGKGDQTKPIGRSMLDVRGWVFDVLPTLLLLLMLPAAVQAEDYTYTTNIGTITITGYTGPGGAVTIPNTIHGLPVSRIEDDAFQSISSLTSVTIPESVTSIGATAFHGCSSLTSATIGNSVTNIGSYAFGYCAKLTAITVVGLNSVYSSVDGILFDKSQTSLIQCPGGKVGTYALPNSVTSIGYMAFGDCIKLTSIIIPDSVISIGIGAFNYCISVTNVTIPDSVTSIGRSAFGGCMSLREITVAGLNSVYSSVGGVLLDKSQTTLIECPGGKVGAYTLPDSVTSIGELAFGGCTKLTSIIIPNSVTSIGIYAFNGCTSLTSVMIPNSVTSIGDGVFNYCISLASVTIPDSVTSIGDYVFASCTSLASVTIGSGVNRIGGWVFAGCTSLTSIDVNPANPSYGSLEGVLFNKSKTALFKCPEGKTGSYTIPTSVTSIGDWAFHSCHSLASVTLPASVTNIGNWAFSGCASLTRVTIGSGVTSIGDEAFESCDSLTGVYFLGGPPSLGDSGSFGADYSTVYYLPGTTGWGSAFGDLPTALWVLPYPLILNNGPSFGVQTNGFGFIISWATNVPVVVEASTNLASPTWLPLQTNALTDGSTYFSDSQWTNYPNRFYRLRSP